MKNINDLRILKTKKALFNSLIELLQKNSFENIKISDICENALTSRSTFYAHYNDKYELLVDLLENQKSILLTQLRNNKYNVNTKEYYLEIIRIIVDNVDKNRKLYSNILIKNKNGILFDIFMKIATKDFDCTKINESNKPKVPYDVISRFYLGGIVCLSIDLIIKNPKYTKEEIITYLDKLTPNNL